MEVHRPRSAHAVFVLRRSGYLLLLALLAVVASNAFLIVALYLNDRSLVIKALPTLVGSGLFFIIAHLLAAAARCPLCTNRVLHSSRCQRNRHARPLLGSYRLRVVRDIVLFNRFRCPYCGELTECVPRERPG